jgi:hypothetical protein
VQHINWQTCVAHYPDTVVMPIRGRWRWLAAVTGAEISA